MDEIERRQGVTIIEVDARPSIGDEGDEAPPPPATEESEIQEALAAVTDAIEVAYPPRGPWRPLGRIRRDALAAAVLDELGL